MRVAREFVVDDADTGEELGRIDLCLLYGHEESVYFAFECKRLNVPFPSGMKSLAGEYVGSQGMMCFVTGKYADGHEHGGMIGFVMSGDVGTAIQAVRHAIECIGIASCSRATAGCRNHHSGPMIRGPRKLRTV